MEVHGMQSDGGWQIANFGSGILGHRVSGIAIQGWGLAAPRLRAGCPHQWMELAVLLLFHSL